jgi:hypothetical protein
MRQRGAWHGGVGLAIVLLAALACGPATAPGSAAGAAPPLPPERR